jgi:hypothetical protein
MPNGTHPPLCPGFPRNQYAFMADHFLVEDWLVDGAKINIEIGYQRCLETGANFVEDRIGNGTDFIEGGRIVGSNGYLVWKIIPKRSKS